MSRIKDLQKKVYHVLEKNIDDADKRAKAVAHLHGVALAASILAKVYRDNLMVDYATTYPEYAFEKHKGYGTKFHVEKIKEIGPCKIHRRTFIKNFWVQ